MDATQTAYWRSAIQNEPSIRVAGLYHVLIENNSLPEEYCEWLWYIVQGVNYLNFVSLLCL